MPKTFTLTAQFNSHRGPTSQGDHKIVFDVQPEEKNVYPFLEEMSRYPSVVLKIFPQDGSGASAGEQEWDTNNRRIHAMLGEVAERWRVGVEDVKRDVKSKLVAEGKIQASMKELTVAQQGDVIERLRKVLE